MAYRYDVFISISNNFEKAIVAGGFSNSCVLYNLANGQEKLTFKGHTNYVSSVLLTPDGSRAISSSWDKNCILWNIKSGKILRTLKGVTLSMIYGGPSSDDWEYHYKEINTISLTPNGKYLVTGSSDNKCLIWDLSSGERLYSFKGHEADILTTAISPDGKILISGSKDLTCISWDIKSRSLIKTMKGHANSVYCISITPDGKKAISGSWDGTCIIWDIKNGQILNTLKGHKSLVLSIAINSDGKRILSSSNDRTCIIWDIDNGKQLARFVSDSIITAIAYFSDGVIAANSSGKLIFFNIDKELMCTSIPITTIRKIWKFENYHYSKFIADCPICGFRITPTKSVINYIAKISKKAGLKINQSPCQELPDEAWEEPGLLGNCPNCGERLKFNPFIVGGDDFKENSNKKLYKLWWKKIF
jgi:WD40 repeat protein